LVAVVVVAGGCVQGPEIGGAGLPIGVLLPFTGDVAASGTNIERAIIFATDAVNAAGGVADTPLRLIARDTASLNDVGIDAARSLIDDDDVIALLGPEEDDIAKRVVPLIRAGAVVQISGGVTSPTFTTINDDGYWFRTVPSTLTQAQTLAERMAADGVRSAALLYVEDEYGTGYTSVLSFELNSRGIDVRQESSFSALDQGFGALLRDVLSDEPDALVLMGYPKSGAAIVQEWAIAGGRGRWYLTGKLKDDGFLQNVPPGALNGAVGVSPAVAADFAKFTVAFGERWDGDQPLPAAYFYYDAAAILALAMEAASVSAGGAVPAAADVRDHLRAISEPPGTSFAWYELDAALEAIRAGDDIDYRGASGTVDLDRFGDTTDERVETWTVVADRIQTGD
jgi:ABC-type branched-subunit amino acid transport system substrate-binding protein